jgi:hypothetical protein
MVSDFFLMCLSMEFIGLAIAVLYVRRQIREAVLLFSAWVLPFR